MDLGHSVMWKILHSLYKIGIIIKKQYIYYFKNGEWGNMLKLAADVLLLTMVTNSVPVTTMAESTTTPVVSEGVQAEEEPFIIIEEPMTALTPAQAVESVEELNFDYDIASYTTKYTGADSLNRNYNMRLASDSINGVILEPGENFSFNDIILKNSHNGADYKSAAIYVNGRVSTGIGGGICQISSTLYQAALYSGMTITERRNHSLKVGYMPNGRDATASWGTIDFQFRNDLDVPVKIESVMNNGVVKIRFLAPKDPNIGKIQVDVIYQADGTYVLKRTREDGTVDHVATSRYRN